MQIVLTPRLSQALGGAAGAAAAGPAFLGTTRPHVRIVTRRLQTQRSKWRTGYGRRQGDAPGDRAGRRGGARGGSPQGHGREVPPHVRQDREWYRSTGGTELSRDVDDALIGILNLSSGRQHLRDRYVFRVLRIAEDTAAGRAPSARRQSPSSYKHALDAAHRDLAERLIEGIGRTASDGTVRGVASSVRASTAHLQALGIDGPAPWTRGPSRTSSSRSPRPSRRRCRTSHTR